LTIITKVKLAALCNMYRSEQDFLQGSVVTQTIIGGLAIYLLVANFLSYIRAKN